MADYVEGTFDFDDLHRLIREKVRPPALSEISENLLQIASDASSQETIQGRSSSPSPNVKALDWTGLATASSHFIGGGGFADVYFVQWSGLSPDESEAIPPVVIKKFRVPDSSLRDKKFHKRVKREVQVWSILKHENIVPFLGVCHYPNEAPSLLSEYMENGPVNKYIDKQPEACLYPIMFGVAKGLNYLHDKHVVHGDIKAENILINRHGIPCLCDFGLSKILVDSTLWKSSAAQAGGTLRWQAPELLSGTQGAATKDSDVYSYGVTCYEIMTNSVPFSELKLDYQVIMSVTSGKTLQRSAANACMTDFVWELLTKCWTFEPAERPIVPYILNRLSTHVCDFADKSQCLFRERGDDTAKLHAHESDQEDSDDE